MEIENPRPPERLHPRANFCGVRSPLQRLVEDPLDVGGDDIFHPIPVAFCDPRAEEAAGETAGNRTVQTGRKPPEGTGRRRGHEEIAVDPEEDLVARRRPRRSIACGWKRIRKQPQPRARGRARLPELVTEKELEVFGPSDLGHHDRPLGPPLRVHLDRQDDLVAQVAAEGAEFLEDLLQLRLDVLAGAHPPPLLQQLILLDLALQ